MKQFLSGRDSRGANALSRSTHRRAAAGFRFGTTTCLSFRRSRACPIPATRL